MSVVIVNPSSASGSTGEAWPQIASDLRSQFGAFRVVFTKHRGDAAALANEAARKGAKFVIACGGDGTISEVANGILSSGKDAELGILPSGTGGDFRRTLEFLREARDAARILRTGRTARIDVGRVSYVDNNGRYATRYFVGVASCGMSTKVIERVKTDHASFASALIKTAMRNEARSSGGPTRRFARAPSRRFESMCRKCTLFWGRDEDRSRCETDGWKV